MSNAAHQVFLQGTVQGIGLRPALLRWAIQCKVTGWLSNTNAGVELHLEGRALDVKRFLSDLSNQLPRLAQIRSMRVIPSEWEGFTSFTVRQQLVPGAMETAVPLDQVSCVTCLQELSQTSLPRRKNYAFNCCTVCGPRYSLIRQMPFEHDKTAMSVFPLCRDCQAEYEEQGDRRFHAQTISCCRCGPQLSLSLKDIRASESLAGDTLIQKCISALKQGMIVSIKGIGGYQLLCDATNAETIHRLRQRKSRPRKALAVMVKDLAVAARLADIADLEAVLSSSAGPIVLCPAVADTSIAHNVHPGLSDIGLMLPSSALHHLLCYGVDRPLIVTSGNREGEPLVFRSEETHIQLSEMSDAILHHEREIIRPIDDSVVRVIAGKPVNIRLGRGLAPLSLPVKISKQICAFGGQQKVAIALSNNSQSILGPHLGDMDTVASQTRFQEQYLSLCQLYDCQPSCLVHDQHPDYFTTCWSENQRLTTLSVQHHHAHIVAGMLEHQWLDRPVLGIAFDGTGLGDDGTIWGGEILHCTTTEYHRVGHVRRFPLLGNEMAIRQPQRLALALLREVVAHDMLVPTIQNLKLTSSIEPIVPLLERANHYLQTSSMGRLFDGLACLVLSLSDASYEGEPAMLLEAKCDRRADGHYPFPFTGKELDWRPLVQALLQEIDQGVEQSTIAMRCHRSMALAVAAIIAQYQRFPVVLSGGCFQNKILVELIMELVDDRNKIGLSGMIPCNDGGLAAGQLVIAAARMNALVL